MSEENETDDEEKTKKNKPEEQPKKNNTPEQPPKKKYSKKNTTIKPSSSSIIVFHNEEDEIEESPRQFNDLLSRLAQELYQQKIVHSTTTTPMKCNNTSSPPWFNENQPVDELHVKISSLQDLIDLSELYTDPHFEHKNYTINIKGLYQMKNALIELQSMVGLQDIKRQITEQIVFCSQLLTLKKSSSNGGSHPQTTTSNSSTNTSSSSSPLSFDSDHDMFHTCIFGKPGVGKTAFAKILAKIYLSLGITSKDTFVIARRTDLVGEYLGHTAMKTQRKINEAMGGVLFIDEVYTLGSANDNTKQCDSFSKECIDTLNQNLTENKGNFICIIAGYREEVNKYFFNINPGLRRRFTFTYQIADYTPEELKEILLLKLNLIQWSIQPECQSWITSSHFFQYKMEFFPHFAGDIESLLLNIKIAHAQRIYGKSIHHHKIICQQDIEQGYQRYLTFRNATQIETTPVPASIAHLYL